MRRPLRRPAAIIFIPKNFGMVDAFLPLVPELAEKSAGCAVQDIVFRRESVFQDYCLSEFHVRIFEQYTRVHRLFTRSGRFARVQGYSNLLHLILLILYRRVTSSCVKVVYSHVRSEGGTALEDRIFDLLHPLGVQLMSFPSTQGVINERFMERFSEKAWRKWLELGAKRGPRVVPIGPPMGLCYTAAEVALRNGADFTHTRFVPIGIPRLYGAWQRTLRDIGTPHLDQELTELGIPGDRAQEIVTVILTNPRFLWYKREDSFERLIDMAVGVIRRTLGDIPILLKVKLSMHSSFDGKVASRPDSGVYVSSCALSVLSLRTAFAVSIHESSGAFDMLLNGVPCVEISEYSDDWKSLFPYLSPWAGLPGYHLATSEEEFERFVRSHASGTLARPTRSELVSYFGHDESLSSVMADGSLASGQGADLQALQVRETS